MQKYAILSLIVLIMVCGCSNQENAVQTSEPQTEDVVPSTTASPTSEPTETILPTKTTAPTETTSPAEPADACIAGSSWENTIQERLSEILSREIVLEFVDGSELDTQWSRIWSGKLEDDSQNTHKYAYNILMDCVFLASADSYITNQKFSEVGDLQSAFINTYGDDEVLLWSKTRLNDCRAVETSGQNYVDTFFQSNGSNWTFNCMLVDNNDYSIKLNVVY